MWRTLRAYLELPHPWAVLVVMLATALFGLLAAAGAPDPARFALMLLAMFGGQLAIGVINEYRDRHLDARSKPHRPIPSGLVGPRAALAVAGLGLALHVAAGLRLGAVSFGVASLGTGCGIAYDLWFKGTRWSWLPYLVALPLLPTWVWLTLDDFEPALLLLYPLGAPMVVAVHLAQSLPDAESDRASGVGSLVARLGARRAWLLVASAALLAAVEVAVFAMLVGRRPAPALLAAGIVVGAVAASLAARRVIGPSVERHLFKLMGALAVVLGLGWMLSTGL